jgi:ADP-ribose pyrophosphatase YjhB (NUDIX family)
MFRAWWRVKRGMTLGVRGLACDAEGRVLLVRHTYRSGWYLPGGGVESGQSALDAVVREMAEEGAVAATTAPALIGFYSNHAFHPNDHVAFYHLQSWRPCPPLDNGEIAERGFFARDALPANASPGTRRRLAEVFDGAALSAHW